MPLKFIGFCLPDISLLGMQFTRLLMPYSMDYQTFLQRFMVKQNLSELDLLDLIGARFNDEAR
jgi:hypothetical protein